MLHTILMEYDERRAAAEDTARAKAHQLMSTVTEYAQLETQIRKLHLQGMRRALSGEEGDMPSEDIASSVSELRARQAEILTAMGYAPDHLTPRYTCMDCGDTGYVAQGRMCHCLRQRLMQEQYRQSHIDPTQTFENYALSIFPDEPVPGQKYSQRELMTRLYEVSSAYAQRFPENAKPNILLHGGTGLGKTYLLNCIANEVIKNGHTVTMVTAYQLYQTLMNNLRDQEHALPSPNVDLLILDDLGVEPMVRNITIETLFNLLNERMINKKATIISTNLSLPQIKERYFDRVLSRLLDPSTTSVYRLYGEDVRLSGRR